MRCSSDVLPSSYDGESVKEIRPSHLVCVVYFPHWSCSRFDSGGPFQNHTVLFVCYASSVYMRLIAGMSTRCEVFFVVSKNRVYQQ